MSTRLKRSKHEKCLTLLEIKEMQFITTRLKSTVVFNVDKGKQSLSCTPVSVSSKS